jgi:hypothetical protein
MKPFYWTRAICNLEYLKWVHPDDSKRIIREMPLMIAFSLLIDTLLFPLGSKWRKEYEKSNKA